jgi:hypothetical protein
MLEASKVTVRARTVEVSTVPYGALAVPDGRRRGERHRADALHYACHSIFPALSASAITKSAFARQSLSISVLRLCGTMDAPRASQRSCAPRLQMKEPRRAAVDIMFGATYNVAALFRVDERAFSPLAIPSISQPSSFDGGKFS